MEQVAKHTSATHTAEALKTLRSTYQLLALTLAFSAIVAMISASLALPHPGLLLTLGGFFGLLFLTHKTANSAWGLVSVFALTGFMGYTIGPLLNVFLATAHGTSLVAIAGGTTAVIFLALSAYARTEDALDFRSAGNFLLVGILVAFCLGLAAYFFAIPMLALAVSGLFVLLMSGLIIYETQNILRGGETNYILATVTLFVALYNLFTSLLHLLSAFAGDEG